MEGKRNYGGRGRVFKKTRVVIGVNQQGRETKRGRKRREDRMRE